MPIVTPIIQPASPWSASLSITNPSPQETVAVITYTNSSTTPPQVITDQYEAQGDMTDATIADIAYRKIQWLTNAANVAANLTVGAITPAPILNAAQQAIVAEQANASSPIAACFQTPTLTAAQIAAGQVAQASTAASIAAAFNTANISVTVSTFLNAAQLISKLTGAVAVPILNALQASTDATAKWLMQFITTRGIDFGDSQVQAELNALVTAGTLTQAQVTALTGLAVQTISRAQQLGISVSAADVTQAIGIN